MQVTINGTVHEITEDDARKLHMELAKHLHPAAGKHHTFMVGGRQIAMTAAEMKEVADYWWENHGKHSMQKFFQDYQARAADNIRKALGFHNPPADEKEVKSAIAQAFMDGDVDLIAEVVFEAMEWQTAYSNLENIDK